MWTFPEMLEARIGVEPTNKVVPHSRDFGAFLMRQSGEGDVNRYAC